MREILFRGKAINRDRYAHYKYVNFRTDYKNGDWVYGLLTKKFDERFENLPAEMTNEDGISGIDVDYKTIGQYTGLTDKNGKKIFEGDVIIDNFFKLLPNKPHIATFYEAYRYGENEDLEFEIIGNIYDNPELLNGE